MKRLRFDNVNGKYVTNVPISDDNLDVILDLSDMTYVISSLRSGTVVGAGTAKNNAGLKRVVRDKLIELGVQFETETRIRRASNE